MSSNTYRPPLTVRRVGVYLTLIVFALIFLLPIYLIVTTGLKARAEVNLDAIWILPKAFNLESFQVALEKLAPSLWNSAVLTVVATAVSSMAGSMNGYILSKWKFPGANIIFPLMLFGMFIPYQSILIPLFQTLRSMNLYGGLPGLMLAHIVYGLPITTLIFRNYYVEVPTEMIEAAQMDGAGFFGIYARVIFPISLPSFVVVIIWQFTQIWNEYLFAVMLTRKESQPVTVALAQLTGGQAIDFSLQMAASLLTALPTVMVYIFLGRYFIRGLLAGSVKG